MWWMGASGCPAQRAFTPSRTSAGAAASAQKPSAVTNLRRRQKRRAPKSGTYIHPSYRTRPAAPRARGAGHVVLERQAAALRGAGPGTPLRWPRSRSPGCAAGRARRPRAAQKPAPGPRSRPAIRYSSQRPPARRRARGVAREDAVAQQPHERANEGEVQWAVLIRFQVSVPEMGIRRPPFGELDAHRRVAVVLVTVREGQGGARGRRPRAGTSRSRFKRFR